MKITEKLLLLLSRKPGSEDYPAAKDNWNIDNALNLLIKTFPNFPELIVNKMILDFGCGEGYQSLAMAKNGAQYVLGVDSDVSTIKKAQRLVRELNLENRVVFVERLDGDMTDKFDIIISQNSMEHFSNPISVIKTLKSALKQDGKIFITFAPPWFSPYGSHMHFFTKLPWVNIIFGEKTVMSVRAYFRADGATKYEEVEQGLNRMTVNRFEHIIYNSGLEIHYLKYHCVKGLDILGKLPLVREFFINKIDCIVTK